MQNIINKKKHPEVLASVLTDKEYRAWINWFDKPIIYMNTIWL